MGHVLDRPIAAVVDLGTNAARLAMASLDDSGGLVSRGRWRELTRMGEGLEATGKLSDAAIKRSLETLQNFSRIIGEKKVEMVDAVATSALRDASNGKEFIAEAVNLGIPLRVIPAEEEARLALAGVAATLGDFPGSALIFDIGGGSLELIQAAGSRISKMASLPAGVVYLMERFLGEMPTAAANVDLCTREIRDMLEGASGRGIAPEDLPLIGCGGGVALAWFIREGVIGEAGITGSILNFDEIEGWVPRFAALDKEGRRALPGFEPGREDVALAGLIVVREVLRWAGQPALKVSTGGVREGRLLEMLRG